MSILHSRVYMHPPHLEFRVEVCLVRVPSLSPQLQGSFTVWALLTPNLPVMKRCQLVTSPRALAAKLQFTKSLSVSELPLISMVGEGKSHPEKNPCCGSRVYGPGIQAIVPAASETNRLQGSESPHEASSQGRHRPAKAK